MFVIEDVKVGENLIVARADSNKEKGFQTNGIVKKFNKYYVLVEYNGQESWFDRVTGFLVRFTKDQKILHENSEGMPIFVFK